MTSFRYGRGFTLIELIFVMAVLATVLAYAAPILSDFVRGRSLREETRRFLALTRYGRSEAISSSAPLKLWIDPESGDYGIEPFPGYSVDDGKKIEWKLNEDLSFKINASATGKDRRVIIIFRPDGSIDSESVERIEIESRGGESLSIERAASKLEYTLQNNEARGS